MPSQCFSKRNNRTPAVTDERLVSMKKLSGSVAIILAAATLAACGSGSSGSSSGGGDITIGSVHPLTGAWPAPAD